MATRQSNRRVQISVSSEVGDMLDVIKADFLKEHGVSISYNETIRACVQAYHERSISKQAEATGYNEAYAPASEDDYYDGDPFAPADH